MKTYKYILKKNAIDRVDVNGSTCIITCNKYSYKNRKLKKTNRPVRRFC